MRRKENGVEYKNILKEYARQASAGCFTQHFWAQKKGKWSGNRQNLDDHDSETTAGFFAEET